MGTLLKIIQTLAAAIPALLDWWQQRQDAQAREKAADRVADIRRDPAAEWLRKFNSQTKPGADPAGTAGPDQPDGHA